MLIWSISISLALLLLIWLAPLFLRWTILLSSWIAELPIAWMILLFILFPPALFVFLAGIGFHQLGLSKKILAATDRKATHNVKNRKALGYDK